MLSRFLGKCETRRKMHTEMHTDSPQEGTHHETLVAGGHEIEEAVPPIERIDTKLKKSI